MVASLQMAKKKQSQSPAGEREKLHPEGPLVSVSREKRRQWKLRREELKLTQRKLAALVGVTSGTISNLETGRHPQVRRNVYASLERKLSHVESVPEAVSNDNVYRELVENTFDMSDEELAIVLAVAKTVKKPD